MALLAAYPLGSAQAATLPSRTSKAASLTVLEAAGYQGVWTTLDPPPAVAGANQDYLDAIYGTLFDYGTGGTIIPDLAVSYKLLNGGTTLEIFLRHGVVFQDGTPFNAAAVAYNIKRDLEPQEACSCAPGFPVSTITTPTNYEVILNLTRPYAPIIYSFFNSAPNFIASPTALTKMGAKAFGVAPVGAGPFKVVTDIPSAKLVLERNPSYWQKGHPKLAHLTFTTAASDESAYEGLLSGEAQVYPDLTTYRLLKSMSKQVRITSVPSRVGAQFLQLNTFIPPFNNILAREALYYATNVGPINKTVTDGYGTVTQSGTEPGGLYFEPKVPGYRTYNPKKARALVKELGGLTVNLGTEQEQADDQIIEELQAEWSRVGIHTTLNEYATPALVEQYKAGKWEAMVQNAGGINPALANALPFRFVSSSKLTGVHDSTLDALISKAAGILQTSKQPAAYRDVFRHISDNAYAPYLFVLPQFNLTTHGVSGPGLTTKNEYQIRWQDVSMS